MLWELTEDAICRKLVGERRNELSCSTGLVVNEVQRNEANFDELSGNFVGLSACFTLIISFLTAAGSTHPLLSTTASELKYNYQKFPNILNYYKN